MKKLVLVICTLLCANVLFAQENITKEKDLEAVVDSLSAKLKELQHNYDYLYCQYLLDEFKNSQIQESNSISIRTNQLKIDISHGRFNYDLYNAYKKNYNSSIEKLDVSKENAKSIKNLVTLKMITSNFSENELSVLQQGLKLFDYAINSVESALELYDLWIKKYRNM
jgi:hypothetical protein